MTPSIQIRAATPADAAVIVQFNAWLAEETEQRVLSPRRLRAGVEAVLTDGARGTYFVAQVDGEIAGQVLLTWEWSDWRNGSFWWMQSVYVKKTFRRRGIFKALLHHVQTLAGDRDDLCGLRLYVDGRNSQAKAVYQQLGLRLTHYQVMELDLARPAT